MNRYLQTILDIVQQYEALNEEDKNILVNAVRDADKELTITAFKLERTEKVKRTTAILLEETIEELEKKRADVVKSNEALQKSIEDLKAAQSQLIQSEKMASLGELTAGIAHEIQNPLNFVNNFSEVSVDLLEELNEELNLGHINEVKEVSSDLKHNLEKIHHHGRRASDIVKAMLQHSRTSTGEKELTDINALCDEYLRLAYHGMRARDKSFNADFKLEMDESLPKVNVVPQDIGRVLLNLINNAFYAVVDKGRTTEDRNYKPEVRVYTKLSPSGGGQGEEKIEIRVMDNGPGIPEEIREKIFQPFFTTKPTGQGTGLGLSLSYDIITKGHGGSIEVNTSSGMGTEFTIKLPLI